MYTLAHTIAVNPPEADPVLERRQVWRGLEMKAENAIPFVPGMERCDVTERDGNRLTREIAFKGTAMMERVTLYPPVQVRFERIGTEGFIENTLSDSAEGLQLTFTFSLAFPGIAPDSDLERETGDEMRDAYVAAVAATLDRVRAMVRGGELA